MNLNEAISILKENHYKVIDKPVMNESEIRFNTADDYLAYRSKLINSSWAQNTVQIGCQNTILSEKELNDTGKDIGEIVLKRYCKDFESNKKDLQESWNLGWESEDPNPMTEDTFKKLKSKKAVYEECNAIYQKGAIMHAFLNNF